MSPARLSALDAAFLSLESADAPMHVGWAARVRAARRGAAAALRGRARAHRVAAGTRPALPPEARVGAARPGRSGVGRRPGVRRRRPRPAAPRTATSRVLVDEVLSAPLQPDRPLWELWIAEQLDDGMIGVVGKAHHCLVDGLAAVELMALLLDAEPAANGAAPAPARPSTASTAGCRARCRRADARRRRAVAPARRGAPDRRAAAGVGARARRRRRRRVARREGRRPGRRAGRPAQPPERRDVAAAPPRDALAPDGGPEGHQAPLRDDGQRRPAGGQRRRARERSARRQRHQGDGAGQRRGARRALGQPDRVRLPRAAVLGGRPRLAAARRARRDARRASGPACRRAPTPSSARWRSRRAPCAAWRRG